MSSLSVYARRAYVANRWLENVRIEVSRGLVRAVTFDQSPVSSDYCVDVVLPGIPNAHSHAFQRGMVGLCEQLGLNDQNNFWTWREEMYRLANSITAEGVLTIARQVYTEMLEAGYTSVAEFHYLHGEKNNEGVHQWMYDSIVQAAADTGIRLIYLPIVYHAAGFNNQPLHREQYRFKMLFEDLITHMEYVQTTDYNNVSFGIGIHSLRAVSLKTLEDVSSYFKSELCPIHLHIAEQIGEVEQCLEVHKKRPIELLLDQVSIDKRWCLVHATHTTVEELKDLSRTNAVICLCPSTEANLGDGLFSLRAWLDLGGQIAIGTDSQVTIDPFEELRWLEYGQRLTSKQRNISYTSEHQNVGWSLFDLVLRGGHQASGFQRAALQVGAPADLLTISEDDVIVTAHNCDTLLDALVFTGGKSPIDRVMVGGKWVVKQGSHINQTVHRTDFLNHLRMLR